ncbi:GTPase HflX [Synechococcus sp. PCC 7336]|uniref:GTPase HflX n=1 Tax=Synechococcus sp. PCC 7336 TaxID=195250 RepID=UPI000347FD32|nr:GTPase HflX [Synechococcus sp. PCC 7336]
MYQQRLPRDRLLTAEFAQRLGAVGATLKPQSVSAFVNRRGQVIRVAIGNPMEAQIPLLELPRQGAERLSGIRCISTQYSTREPGQKTLLAMALQRLDALVTLHVTGEGSVGKQGRGAAGFVSTVHLSHLVPAAGDRWSVSPPLQLGAAIEENFLDLVEGLESEFSRLYSARQVDGKRDRAVLVGLLTAGHTQDQLEERLSELELLVDSAGGDVLEALWQRRDTLHPKTAIGPGKVQELALLVQDVGANMVVFDRELSPSQVRTLEDRVGVRALDRTEVILDIFAQRARSRAGKLQVELAQLEYLMPRLAGRGRTMSRLGGGIGTRGPGETKLEMERRGIQRRIALLQKQVNELQAHRRRLRQRRQQRDIPTIAIVGYTNAGKSTLLNALTASDAYAADRLFATLDPTTRRLQLDADTPLLLTDTVGFMTELPPQLVDAFRATLEEVTEADALLHVVDLSHPSWLEQIEAVDKLLDDMTVATGPRQLVFNKIDRVPAEQQTLVAEKYPRSLQVSATERLNFDTLLEVLGRFAQRATLKAV